MKIDFFFTKFFGVYMHVSPKQIPDVWDFRIVFFMEISVKISQRDSPKFNKRSTWMLIWPHQLPELHTMVHFFKQRFTRNLLDKNKDQ